MRIAIVAPGLHHYAGRLAAALASHGHQVTLLTDATKPHYATSDHAYRTLGTFGLLSPSVNHGLFRQVGLGKVVNTVLVIRAALKVMRICRETEPDIIHFHGVIRWEPLTILAIWRLRRRGFRVVHTTHNVGPRSRYPGSRAAFRSMLKLSHAVIVHSQEAKRRVVSVYGLEENSVQVVPLPSYEMESTMHLSKEEARRALGLPPDGRLLLFFGLIRPYKGLDLLIQAVGKLVHLLPEVHLAIVGRVVGGFETHEASLRSLGLTSHVHHFLHWIPEPEVGQFFCSADVVVLPYQDLFEIDQSAVLRLAESWGKPVVATAVGGIREQMISGETGILVPPGNVEALTDALHILISDEDLLARMGRNAYAHSLTLSWATAAKRASDLYERVMDDSRSVHEDRSIRRPQLVPRPFRARRKP